MNARKVAVFLIFVLGMTLIVLGGVYNPYTEVIDLPSGGFRGLGFRMYQGEVVNYNLTSFNTFTIYIMNKSQFQWLMDNGTFNGSYYTQTGKSMNLEFSVPYTGVYYIVIANFNSKTSIEVDLTFKKTLNWPLTITGTSMVISALIFLFIEIRNAGKRPPADSICPQCGSRISGSWNYCPYCRYELGGKDNEI